MATELIHIEGRANKVFRILESMAERHPKMTLKELEERGLARMAYRQSLTLESLAGLQSKKPGQN